MSTRRDDTELVAELRALRPEPGATFVAELDARAAAGFPSAARSDSAIGRLAEKLRGAPRGRLPAFAGAAATIAIAAATAVVAISEGGPATSTTSQRQRPAAVEASGEAGSPQSGSASAGGSVQYGGSPPPSYSGPYAARVARREIERSARVVLLTEASGVRSAAARVFETVHSYDGIVMRSSVRDGSGGAAGAVFDLLVPSGKLGDALAAFSEIAEVRSRSESTLDVTAPTIGLEERLRDARVAVEGLQTRLAGADTSAERDAIEAELRAERRRLASLRSRLAGLQRRTHFSRVSLRIEAGDAAAAGNRWGVEEALDDAGRILGIAAGVAVIGLAILAPIALTCLLAWLIGRTWIRRSRERVLDRGRL